MFRSKADMFIDRAHNAIASAEMLVEHSFTEEAKRESLDALFQAQRFLRRAVETKRAWYAVEHDDYEQYPDVPENDGPLAEVFDFISRKPDAFDPV